MEHSTSRAAAIEDGALVMGNMMNEAHSIGIGSCWIHRGREVFDSDEGKALKEKWGIPETTFKTVVDAVGVILIGFGILNNPTDKANF